VALPPRILPSDAEIAVIEALAAQDEIIVARIPGEGRGFHTRLLYVDPRRQFILILGSADPASSAALLGAPQAILFAEPGEWRIEITADNPQPAVRDGVRAIRLAFPHSIAIKRRRMVERTSVPALSSLQCVTYSGGEERFRGTVTDISPGGIGIVQEFTTAPLRSGEELPECHLERPGRDPVLADLKVRFAVAMTLEDGQSVLKIGFQFLNPSTALASLISEFAVE
jgi:c-di-GMP-binding flagellar brake protein YcgR